MGLQAPQGHSLPAPGPDTDNFFRVVLCSESRGRAYPPTLGTAYSGDGDTETATIHLHRRTATATFAEARQSFGANQVDVERPGPHPYRAAHRIRVA